MRFPLRLPLRSSLDPRRPHERTAATSRFREAISSSFGGCYRPRAPSNSANNRVCSGTTVSPFPASGSFPQARQEPSSFRRRKKLPGPDDDAPMMRCTPGRMTLRPPPNRPSHHVTRTGQIRHLLTTSPTRVGSPRRSNTSVIQIREALAEDSPAGNRPRDPRILAWAP
jgi:hypothetical protein